MKNFNSSIYIVLILIFIGIIFCCMSYLLLARDVIFYAMLPVHLSVRLSVTEVHWHIIANLGFKFRSHFIAHCGRRAACSTAAVLLAGESSRAMLASARLSCFMFALNVAD